MLELFSISLEGIPWRNLGRRFINKSGGAVKVSAFVSLALLFSGQAQTQVVPLGPNPASPAIAGVQVSCYGVPTFVNHELQDIAYAFPGAIHLNPGFFNLSPPIQIFIYAHECAHQMPQIGSNEQEADCWAVRTGRDQGWLNQNGLAVVMADALSSPGDWTHLPGPYRVAQMQACFDG